VVDDQAAGGLSGRDRDAEQSDPDRRDGEALGRHEVGAEQPAEDFVRSQSAGAEISCEPAGTGPCAGQGEHDDRQQHQTTAETDHRRGQAGASPRTQLVGEAAVDLRLHGDDAACEQHHRNGGDPDRA
jgi:hypothetical protein